MKTKLLLGVATASVLLFSSAVHSQDVDQLGHASPAPGTANDAMSTVKDAARHAAGTISAEMTTTLQGFVPAAAISDMYEVEAGKIATQRSQSAKVRAFAEKMIKAHTQTSEKLKSLLAASNSAITPPDRLDDRRQGMIDELRGAKDSDFDGRYLSQQVDAHNEALILMRGYAKNGDVPAVKRFAAKTAPVVQMHLNMARHLYEAHK